MSNFNYTTIKGAKMFFTSLAHDFCMPQWVFDKIEQATRVEEVEQIWWAAIKQI